MQKTEQISQHMVHLISSMSSSPKLVKAEAITSKRIKEKAKRKMVINKKNGGVIMI